MIRSIAYIALVVRVYDEAIKLYTKKLNLLVKEAYQSEQDKSMCLFFFVLFSR